MVVVRLRVIKRFCGGISRFEVRRACGAKMLLVGCELNHEAGVSFVCVCRVLTYETVNVVDFFLLRGRMFISEGSTIGNVVDYYSGLPNEKVINTHGMSVIFVYFERVLRYSCCIICVVFR